MIKNDKIMNYTQVLNLAIAFSYGYRNILFQYILHL